MKEVIWGTQTLRLEQGFNKGGRIECPRRRKPRGLQGMSQPRLVLRVRQLDNGLGRKSETSSCSAFSELSTIRLNK